jgi:putative NADH-flavin reductase
VKLTVFGSSGPTGQQLVDQAVSRGHVVTAVVRETAPESRFAESVDVVEADVYNGDNIETAIEDATVVCNVLRHSKLTPPDYVTVAGKNILDAMETVGVDRYLTVVPAAVRRDTEQSGIGESILTSLFRLLRPTVWTDAREHVDDVTARDLNWTVIRVLRLTEGEITRQYRTGDIKLGFGSVSYSNVASFMLDCCERGIYIRLQPKIRT